jgi:uncharacterized membrane protein
MSDRWLFVLTFVSALSCGLVSGVFFAFSNFVMKALGRIPPPQGIAAMQSINVVVINPVFMLMLFGTGVLCILLAGSAWFARERPESTYVIVGALLYVIGNPIVTMVFNVPRNDALQAMDATSAEAARYWADFVVSWTMWNHVRTVTALAAAASLTWALLVARAR